MRIICENCGKKYKINEDRITGESVKIKCKACGGIIKVVKPKPGGIDVSNLVLGTPVPSKSEIPKEEPAEQASEFAEDDAKGTAGSVGLKNSIQTTISAILIFLTTIILLGFVLFNYFATKSEMNEELKYFSEITSTRLSKYLVEPLWGVDEKLIEDSINSEMMEKRIYAIIIFDRDTKRVFTGKKRDSNWKIVATKGNITGKNIKNRKKIIRGKETIGDVEVYVTSKFMEEELYRSVVNFVITAIVLNIAIFLAIFITFRKIIIKPVKELTDVAERMSVGDLNVNIDIKSKNEIGMLAEAIQRMQFSLRLSLDRLRKKRQF